MTNYGETKKKDFKQKPTKKLPQKPFLNPVKNKNSKSVIQSMLEAQHNAFLLELFLEDNRAKKCRKYSFRKKHYERHVEQACLEQNLLMSELKKILPQEMKTIEDPYYGIDYNYNGTTIDQKFSFGDLGENTIKIRVRERRLLNNSDWTMIINKKKEIEFFETKKLALFVKKNWGIIQKRLIEKREYYSEYAMQLEDFYRIEEITPIKLGIEEKELLLVLEGIKAQTKGEHVMQENKKICYLPWLAAITLQ